jgi:hypothetical protein
VTALDLHAAMHSDNKVRVHGKDAIIVELQTKWDRDGSLMVEKLAVFIFDAEESGMWRGHRENVDAAEVTRRSGLFDDVVITGTVTV